MSVRLVVLLVNPAVVMKTPAVMETNVMLGSVRHVVLQVNLAVVTKMPAMTI